jgi:hypothetical protein
LLVVNLSATEPAFDITDQRSIDLALRAIKMSERDLSFSKTNVDSELVLTKARSFLQNPLRLPGYAQSVLSGCAAASNLPAITVLLSNN